jgi:acyl-coenzyme A synthetase/AMP-(fatty) acid ligase
LVLEVNQVREHEMEFIQLLNGELPAYHAVSEIIYQNKFERTDNGKIIRKKF